MLRTIIKATFHFPETESTKADGEEAGDLESDVTSREDADSPTTNSTFATTEGGGTALFVRDRQGENRCHENDAATCQDVKMH